MCLTPKNSFIFNQKSTKTPGTLVGLKRPQGYLLVNHKSTLF